MNSKDLPAAILRLSISPVAYYVDRVMRLFRGEDDIVRKLIRYPMSLKASALEKDASGVLESSKSGKVYVRSNLNNVICSLNEQVCYYKDLFMIFQMC